MATKLTGDWVVGYDGTEHVLIPDGVVIMDGQDIVYVGKSYDGTTERTLGGAGCLIAPGFIDTHVHAGTRTLHRLFSDHGRPELFGQPFLEVALSRPGTHAGMGANVDQATGMSAAERLAVEAEFTAAELISAGITTFLEFGAKLPMQRALLDAVTAIGGRAYLAAGFESGEWSCDDEGRPLFRWDEAIGEAEFQSNLDFLMEVMGSADGRIMGALVPRFSETCTPALLVKCFEKARELGLPVAIHAAYNVHEFYEIVTKKGKTPLQFLSDLGLLELGPKLNLGHCNFLDRLPTLQYSGDEDLALIGGHQCTVSHCPVNLARRGRYLDNWSAYSKAGVNMTLGTDTYPRDMTMQMRMASYFGKVVSKNLHTATAREMFNAATLSAARSLGRTDIGRISAGAKADLQIIDLANGKLRFGPILDPIQALVECGISDDVQTVIVNGDIRMEGRRIAGADMHSLNARAQKMADGIWDCLQSWDPLSRTASEMKPSSFKVI